MVVRGLVVSLVVLSVALAGCAEGPALSIGNQGQWNKGVLETATVSCGDTARFDAGIQGQGHIVITLKDSAGKTAASLTLDGQGQKAMDREVSGTAGDWTVRVEVKDWNMGGSYGSYDYGIDFQGQYGVVVYCASS